MQFNAKRFSYVSNKRKRNKKIYLWKLRATFIAHACVGRKLHNYALVMRDYYGLIIIYKSYELSVADAPLSFITFIEIFLKKSLITFSSKVAFINFQAPSITSVLLMSFVVFLRKYYLRKYLKIDDIYLAWFYNFSISNDTCKNFPINETF